MSGPALWGLTALWAFLPILELRAAIPFAMAYRMPWYIAYPYAAALNALVAPVCWVFLSTLHRLFLKMAWYEKTFNRFVGRARNRLRGGVEKWGWLGVAAFVAVPLPITGAWTGTLGAWALGLSKRKTLTAVVLGVAVAGAVVTLVTSIVLWGTGDREAGILRIFIKEIGETP